MQIIRVLLCIADENLCAHLAALYAQRACLVTRCKDGEQAWQLYQHYHHVIIIVDINLPTLNTLELVSKIRTSKLGQIVQFFVYAPFDMPREAKVLYLNADVSDLIVVFQDKLKFIEKSLISGARLDGRPDLPGAHVLALTDDDALAEQLDRLLSPIPCYIHFGKTHNQAWTQVYQLHLLILILDARTEGALELPARVRGHPMRLVVIHPADATRQDKIAMMEIGADALFELPLVAEELLIRVSFWLNGLPRFR